MANVCEEPKRAAVIHIRDGVRLNAPVAEPAPALTVYDELCRDYRLHTAMIRASEARGNASYTAPFDAFRKSDWIPDLIEELADGMVYCRSRMWQLAKLARTSTKARHAYLTVSNIERRLSRDIAELKDLDTEWCADGVD